jgi:hypothetical protein
LKIRSFSIGQSIGVGRGASSAQRTLNRLGPLMARSSRSSQRSTQTIQLAIRCQPGFGEPAGSGGLTASARLIFAGALRLRTPSGSGPVDVLLVGVGIAPIQGPIGGRVNAGPIA